MNRPAAVPTEQINNDRVVVTEWRAFRGSDIDQIKSKMKGNVIVDGRNIFSPDAAKQAGLDYYGIGRR